MALAPNTGYGLLNPGTTTPAPPNPFLIGAGVGAQTGQTVGQVAAQNPTTFTPRTAYGQIAQSLRITPPPRPAPATYTPPTPQQQQQQSSGANDYTLDPSVQAALAMEQQGLGQLDAQLQAARQRAIINFGDPALAQEAGFGLDPQTGTFAQQNYLSGNATLARLEHLHQLNARQVVNNLAAHGILNSGDYGYLEGEENRGYGNNVYDARQSVLDMLSNLYSNYLNSRQGYQQNILSALLQAAGNAGSQAGGGYYPFDQGVQQQQVSQPTTALTRGGYTLAPSSTAKRRIKTVSGYGF